LITASLFQEKRQFLHTLAQIAKNKDDKIDPKVIRFELHIIIILADYLLRPVFK
jgi:hypothetical protein